MDQWKIKYYGLADGLCVFAEDIFGCQFAVTSEGVSVFDPETADIRPVAASVEEWAAEILDDYPALTGHQLAHDWQAVHGPLAPRDRLLALTPFVGGGEYTVDNLRAVDGARAMRIRGPLARQIHEAPDGAAISVRLTD